MGFLASIRAFELPCRQARPNQGREPPLVWSVEFMKKVHVASNDTGPLVFPLVDGIRHSLAACTGSLAMLLAMRRASSRVRAFNLSIALVT